MDRAAVEVGNGLGGGVEAGLRNHVEDGGVVIAEAVCSVVGGHLCGTIHGDEGLVGDRRGVGSSGLDPGAEADGYGTGWPSRNARERRRCRAAPGDRVGGEGASVEHGDVVERRERDEVTHHHVGGRSVTRVGHDNGVENGVAGLEDAVAVLVEDRLCTGREIGRRGNREGGGIVCRGGGRVVCGLRCSKARRRDLRLVGDDGAVGQVGVDLRNDLEVDSAADGNAVERRGRRTVPGHDASAEQASLGRRDEGKVGGERVGHDGCARCSGAGVGDADGVGDGVAGAIAERARSAHQLDGAAKVGARDNLEVGAVARRRRGRVVGEEVALVRRDLCLISDDGGVVDGGSQDAAEGEAHCCCIANAYGGECGDRSGIPAEGARRGVEGARARFDGREVGVDQVSDDNIGCGRGAVVDDDDEVVDGVAGDGRKAVRIDEALGAEGEVGLRNDGEDRRVSEVGGGRVVGRGCGDIGVADEGLVADDGTIGEREGDGRAEAELGGGAGSKRGDGPGDGAAGLGAAVRDDERGKRSGVDGVGYRDIGRVFGAGVGDCDGVEHLVAGLEVCGTRDRNDLLGGGGKVWLAHDRERRRIRSSGSRRVVRDHGCGQVGALNRRLVGDDGTVCQTGRDDGGEGYRPLRACIDDIGKRPGDSPGRCVEDAFGGRIHIGEVGIDNIGDDHVASRTAARVHEADRPGDGIAWLRLSTVGVNEGLLCDRQLGRGIDGEGGRVCGSRCGRIIAGEGLGRRARERCLVGDGRAVDDCGEEGRIEGQRDGLARIDRGKRRRGGGVPGDGGAGKRAARRSRDAGKGRCRERVTDDDARGGSPSCVVKRKRVADGVARLEGAAIEVGHRLGECECRHRLHEERGGVIGRNGGGVVGEHRRGQAGGGDRGLVADGCPIGHRDGDAGGEADGETGAQRNRAHVPGDGARGCVVGTAVGRRDGGEAAVDDIGHHDIGAICDAVVGGRDGEGGDIAGLKSTRPSRDRLGGVGEVGARGDEQLLALQRLRLVGEIDDGQLSRVAQAGTVRGRCCDGGVDADGQRRVGGDRESEGLDAARTVGTHWRRTERHACDGSGERGAREVGRQIIGDVDLARDGAVVPDADDILHRIARQCEAAVEVGDGLEGRGVVEVDRSREREVGRIDGCSGRRVVRQLRRREEGGSHPSLVRDEQPVDGSRCHARRDEVGDRLDAHREGERHPVGADGAADARDLHQAGSVRAARQQALVGEASGAHRQQVGEGRDVILKGEPCYRLRHILEDGHRVGDGIARLDLPAVEVQIGLCRRPNCGRRDRGRNRVGRLHIGELGRGDVCAVGDQGAAANACIDLHSEGDAATVVARRRDGADVEAGNDGGAARDIGDQHIVEQRRAGDVGGVGGDGVADDHIGAVGGAVVGHIDGVEEDVAGRGRRRHDRLARRRGPEVGRGPVHRDDIEADDEEFASAGAVVLPCRGVTIA